MLSASVLQVYQQLRWVNLGSSGNTRFSALIYCRGLFRAQQLINLFNTSIIESAPFTAGFLEVILIFINVPGCSFLDTFFGHDQIETSQEVSQAEAQLRIESILPGNLYLSLHDR